MKKYYLGGGSTLSSILSSLITIVIILVLIRLILLYLYQHLGIIIGLTLLASGAVAGYRYYQYKKKQKY